jgi:galactokinase
VCGAISSDLPLGAALSSSGALCLAVLHAACAWHNWSLTPKAQILAVRDAEWYAGARSGVSDPAAMVLGRRNTLVNAALLPDQLDISQARYIPFPEGLRILVVQSYTERSLSGAQFVDYVRNRFAYSLALNVLRQEMEVQGFPADLVEKMDRLSAICPESFKEIGGVRALYRLLQSIPEEIPLSELSHRYNLSGLTHAYEEYFGTVPESLWPSSINLRGPLIFGIAESERARIFADVLEREEFERAGRLMTIGHDGDRRVLTDGLAYRINLSDDALDQLMERNTPIETCPGLYGASSPILDALVDEALRAGALGASLTGAGIAGSVLALCHADRAEGIATALRKWLASPRYIALAGRADPLSAAEIASAVIANDSPAAAGELHLPHDSGTG